MRNILKKFEYFSGYVILLAFRKVIGRFPGKLHPIGRFIGRFIYYFSRKHRRIIFSNLSLVFGKEKSKGELTRIAMETCLNVGWSLCEFLRPKRYSKQELKRLFILKGKENVDNALKKGKGAIIVSAHLGNFPFVGIRLAAEGYPLHFLFRNPDAPAVARCIRNVTDSYNVGTISVLPRRAGAAECLRQIRSNKIICILADQYEAESNVFVNFLGVPAATTTGPVSLAVKTGAQILPAFIHREADGRHKIEICSPFSPGGRDDIAADTKALNDIISSYILKYPPQWFWLHRRWK